MNHKMTNTETSSPTNLTDPTKVQESSQGSTEPAGGNDLSEEAKAGFQRSLQKKQEMIEDLKRKLLEKEEKEKQDRLAEMSEVDRYKQLAQESAEKLGKLELELAVSKELEGKEIPQPVRELLIKTPWAIPAVTEELGTTFTWDEAVESVKRNLPTYIESLVVKKDPQPTEEPAPRSVDSERSVDSSVVKDHVYTLSEVTRIKQAGDYEKHRDKILRQMALNGGRLPE